MTIRTWNTLYTLTDMGDGAFLISGHEDYCPVPTPVTLSEAPRVGRRMVYQLASNGHRIVSTPVVRITE